jgi:hypothetical protein
MCDNSHLSLEFITRKAEGLLLYNGPIVPPETDEVLVSGNLLLSYVGQHICNIFVVTYIHLCLCWFITSDVTVFVLINYSWKLTLWQTHLSYPDTVHSSYVWPYELLNVCDDVTEVWPLKEMWFCLKHRCYSFKEQIATL